MSERGGALARRQVQLGGRRFLVIYDADGRVDLVDVEDPVLRDELAKAALSVAAILGDDGLTATGDGYELAPTPLHLRRGLAQSVRFANQPAAAGATAFVVGPRHLMTAAHCVNPSMLASMRFVFGYRVEEGSRVRLHVPEDWVFTAKKLVDWRYDEGNGTDWALVEVDRPLGREPLRIRYDRPVQVGEPVYYLGHPRGLPIKYGGAAEVLDGGTDVFFRANMDTFQGASGAPVFDVKHRLVGIHVRGIPESELPADSNFAIDRVVKTGSPDALGEDSLRITRIPRETLQFVEALF